MKIVGWMAGLSVLSAGVASAAVGSGGEVWLGMAVPLLAVIASWLVVTRTYERHPERLTSVMMTAFVAKALIFGAYCWFVLRVLHVRPVPFAVSLAAYFIALYTTQAVYLERLFAGRMRAA
jgi:hypothetical protein